MSYSDPANPYPSSQFPTSLGKPAVSMDYMRMLSYVFENPNWFMNLLLGGLCSLIPVIGPIVLQGYRYEVVIGLLAVGGARYPDFNFGRFGDYLMRGFWPFLVGLACSLVLLPFYVLILVGAIVGGKAGAALVVLMQLAMLVIVPVFVLVVQPMVLRAALTLDFVQAFQFQWVKDFLRRVWAELLIGMLFLIVSAMVLAPLGLLACCVGILLVGPLVSLANANMQFQVYSIYLSRGGMPIPINPGATPMMGLPPGATPPVYPPKPL